MTRPPAQTTRHRQQWLARLLGAAIAVSIVIASLAIGLHHAAAQMQFDFNGDGEVHCDDFQQQFPDTFTDEASKALQQYPDDLSDLNRDSKDDAIACEGQAADGDPGDGPAAKKNAKSAPTPTPTPAPAAPAEAPVAPPNNATASSDIPADVMARIAGCAVVAISSHDVTAAGCPGVGTLIFHTPDDAPPLPDTVIMNPGAALQQTAPAPRASHNNASTTNTSNETSNGKSSQGGGKADKSGKDNTSDTGKANKNTDNSKKDKNNKKHKGKNGKNDKDNKHGKKSKKHGKKGK